MTKLLVAPLLLGYLFLRTDAQLFNTSAEPCTDDQVQAIVDVERAYILSPECATTDFRAVNTDGIPILCLDADCLAFMTDANTKVPSCVYRGIDYSLGSEFSLVASCEVLGDLSGVSTETTDEASTPPDDQCAESQMEEIADIYADLIICEQCANVDYMLTLSSSGSSSNLFSMDYCTHSECMEYYAVQGAKLPDCNLHGMNFRDGISMMLGMCGYSFDESTATDTSPSSKSNTPSSPDSATAPSIAKDSSGNAATTIGGEPLGIVCHALLAFVLMIAA